MAEGLLKFWGKGKFQGYSAGSHPKGEVHPFALDLLTRLDFPTDGLRSKSWEEFAQPTAPKIDFVFTVCDNARVETCPVWPGQPMTAHWGVADPAVVGGDHIQRMQAFRQAFRELENRIKIFTSLPIRYLDSMKLQQTLHEIGQISIEHAQSEPTESHLYKLMKEE